MSISGSLVRLTIYEDTVDQRLFRFLYLLLLEHHDDASGTGGRTLLATARAPPRC